VATRKPDTTTSEQSVNADYEFVFEATADERRQIANLIDDLDDAQLAKPSLCAGWDIKTMGAHVLSTIVDGLPVFLGLAVRRGSLARAIDERATKHAQLPTREIVRQLRVNAGRPISPPLFGPLDPLADVLVHSGDIKIPLGLPYRPNPSLAALALDFLAGPWPFGFVPLGRLRGLCLHATDIDRQWRSGSAVCGPTAALMMCVAGRTALLQELSGPGLPVLRRRILGE
jgi:uncharacterized protein (TIGR03083 family)